MSDGREEREDRKRRIDEEKQKRPDERRENEDTYDWEPERRDS